MTCALCVHPQYSGYRSASPGLLLREYRSNMTTPVDVTRIYTQSYLADGPTMGYLRRPIEPYDRPPKSPHFHRPPSGERRSTHVCCSRLV